MNRVICDVCGTKYPESSEQCPICGCAKPENARVISDDAVSSDNESSGRYSHVKGGRFSKANVRKRNKAAAAAHEVKADLDTDAAPKEKENNKGLVIAVIALLLAIVAVMLFIFFKYFAPVGNVDDTKGTTAAIETTTVPSTTEPVETTAGEISCTGLVLSSTTVNLSSIGDSWLLNVEIEPQDTTDVLSFTSSDPGVVEVAADGRITAVAAGEATVSVTCGDVTETCVVSVTDPAATTEATVAETTETTEPEMTANWKLNRNDFTLSKQGDSWNLYKGDVDVEDITWTSDDPNVVTVEKGIVTAVGPGYTKVHAEYNGTKYSCEVRCSFTVSSENESTDPTETTETTEETESVQTQVKYYIYIDGVNAEKRLWGADVTLSAGESFQLTLRTENNDVISVQWAASKENICTIDGNKITGKSKGTTEIVVNYGGEIYKCSVTVK